jgi:hypothetical protein
MYFFLYVLFKDAGTISGYTDSNCAMINEQKSGWQVIDCGALLRNFTSLELASRDYTNHNQVDLCSSRRSKRVPSKYNSKRLRTK